MESTTTLLMMMMIPRLPVDVAKYDVLVVVLVVVASALENGRCCRYSADFGSAQLI